MKPLIHPNGKGYIVSFTHPIAKRRMTKGLATTDKDLAESICQDCETLFAKPEILQAPTGALLIGYEKRAIELVFGDERAAELLAEVEKVSTPLSVEDRHAIAAMVPVVERPEHERAARFEFQPGRKATVIEEAPPPDLAVFEKLKTFSPANFEKIRQIAINATRKLKTVEPRAEFLATENARLLRKTNAEVKVAVADAVGKFNPIYAQHRGELTAKRCAAVLKLFVEWLTANKVIKLADLQTKHIDSWVEEMKGDRVGEELSAPSKLKNRNFVSVFMKWATKKWNLVENPMLRVDTIHGGAHAPEHIVAIRRPERITELLDALKPFAYWRAWVATAILAGPRWSEQVHLKIDDVYVEDREIHITTRTSGRRVIGHTKTGKERRVPIESTTLLAILKEHVETRLAEQKKADATEAEKSPYLFPSTVVAGCVKREKTVPGIWSSNRVFLDAWHGTDDYEKDGVKKHGKEGIVEKAQAESGSTGEFWTYSQWEWRHTFGTVLGHVGWSALEIAASMGNTEDVCKDHYVAAVARGETQRWAFKYS
jgi:site-specific recombinase XerD